MEALKPLSEVPGVEAWALIGEDGFVLEAFRKPDVKVGDVLGGLGASALATARAVAEELGKGPLEEVMVEYPEGPVLMVPTDKGPVLMLLLDRVGSLGRVRLALKKVLPRLEEELP